MRIATALNELTSCRDGAGITVENGHLTGKSLFALETAGATHLLVAAPSGALYLAPMTEAITERALTSIDRTRRFVELSFHSAKADRLPEAGAVRTVALARLLLAADTLGAASAMLDQAVAYAKERKQFGRAIGAFQAVKHMCAEMAAELEPARALLWHAAYLFDEDPARAALMACHAKAHLSDIGTFIARTSTEVHGGMGFTDLLGLHYWFKRIGVNRQLFGGPEALRREAAALQGWA